MQKMGTVAKITFWTEIARRLTLGQTQSDISRALNIVQPTISRTVSHPAFREYLDRAAARRDDQVFDVKKYFSAKLEKACRTIDETMDYAIDPHLKFMAAKEAIRLSETRNPTTGRPGTVNNNVQINNNATVSFEDSLQDNPLTTLDQLLTLPSADTCSILDEDFDDSDDLEGDYNPGPDPTYDEQIGWVPGSTLDAVKDLLTEGEPVETREEHVQ
jgi:hypothetical protein